MNLLTLSHNTTFILKNYLQENIKTAWLGHGAFALRLAKEQVLELQKSFQPIGLLKLYPVQVILLHRNKNKICI